MNNLYKWVRWISLVTIIFMSVCSPALATKKRPVKMKTATFSQKITKVEQALGIIKKGKSYKNMGQSLKKLNLTEKEKKSLAKKIKKPPYAGILKRLSDQAEKKAKVTLGKKGRTKAANIKKQADQKQAQELRTLNQQAQAKVNALRARITGVRLPQAPSQSLLHPSNLPDPSGPVANITGISPLPAVVGQRVTIRGEHLGTTIRKVCLALNNRNYECAVDNWTSSRVVVIIPDSLESLVGETEKTGKIFIALPRYSHDIRVGPNPSDLVPSISALSSRTIRPGQTLVVEGTQFLSENQGAVTFRFDSRYINGRISEWENTYVVVSLPDDVSELPEVAGTVKVRNHVGNEVTRSITFEPTIVTKTSRNFQKAKAPFFLIGMKRTFEDNRFNLLNGWTVKDYWLEVVEDDAWGGG